MDPQRIHLVRHDSALGRWDQVTARPDVRLRGMVRRYQGYTEIRAHFPARREMPSGDAVLILGFSGRCHVTDPRTPERTVSVRSMFAGLWDTYALSGLDAGWCGVQVDLSPLGAYAFFGVPMSELSNTLVSLDDLMGAEAELLLERLEEAPGWGTRFELLDELFVSALARGPEPTGTVRAAWAHMVRRHGRVRVASLAEALGCSRHYLWERFRAEVGVTPKTLGRILRFQRALSLLEDPHAELTRVALACGYYDQAHLARDFRAFAGTSPTELSRLRIVGGGGVRDPA